MTIFYALFGALRDVFNVAVYLYVWVLVVGAVLSWLIAFNVVNRFNRLVATISDTCFRLTEPALRRIRRFLPPMGGMDISPIVLIIALTFLQSFINRL